MTMKTSNDHRKLSLSVLLRMAVHKSWKYKGTFTQEQGKAQTSYT